MTIQQLFDEGKEQLIQAGIPDAELDARYLLMNSFKLTYASFLARRNELLPGSYDEINDYRRCIEQRTNRIPLQYIIGSQEFMGLEFYVDSNVLIPRQDTESLVELVLAEHPGRDKRVLDMCTGSGCIAISLAVLGQYRQVLGVDISEPALAVARKNAQKLCGNQHENISFLQSDLFECLKENDRFDMIVSNPPYIPSEIILELQPEVGQFEPLLALDGKHDGLYFYREIIAGSISRLKAGGSIYLEVGHDQSRIVYDLLKEAGYREIKIIKDIPGIERIVTGIL